MINEVLSAFDFGGAVISSEGFGNGHINDTYLVKIEKEDGDTVYFNKKTGGIVFVSPKGYIRSFYLSDLDYFKRQ